MKADLYAALGVERGCSGAEVRRGYRRSAKRAHPDAGGSREAFALVRLAHDVLTDEVRRSRYDADGTCEETGPDTRVAMALNLVAGVLDHVVGQLGEGAAQRDLVDLAKAALHEKVRQLEGQKAGFERGIGQWRRLEGRFRRKGEGENLLAGVVRGKVDALRSMIGQCEAQLGYARTALELLQDYRFEAEPLRAGQGGASLFEQLQQMRQPGRMW